MWDDPYQTSTMPRVSEDSATFGAKGQENHCRLRPDAAFLSFLPTCSMEVEARTPNQLASRNARCPAEGLEVSPQGC